MDKHLSGVKTRGRSGIATHSRATGGAAIAPRVTTTAPSTPTAKTTAISVRSTDSETSQAIGSSSAGTSVAPAWVATLSRLSALLAHGNQPPAFLIPIYKAAARRYRVPWQVLAAINLVETNYGRNLNVSSAGAIGWMQFMPATWRQYAVAARGHGQPNPYDPRDAIFSAARYLAANGAARNLRAGIFAYNHASWYVDEVIWLSLTIKDHKLDRTAASGYALPLDVRYMHQLGRTDDGVDVETAPDGAAVYSITPGVVTAVASNPGGFGPNYPVIRVTSGPLVGENVYYGHVAASLVRVGERVSAGQPIAVVGHTGDAASLGHGHIEIGFSTSTGNPLSHHGATASTASGAAMRAVLVALSAAFGIKNS